MNKHEILAEIRRLASEQSGKPPGWRAFARATGVRESNWSPYIWLRWGDALAEAGFPRNEFQRKIPDDVIVGKYIELTRELGKFPVRGELRRKARIDKDFPSDKAFWRFGTKDKLIVAVTKFCRQTPGYEDVLVFCAGRENGPEGPYAKREHDAEVVAGFVYLMKSGPHYKIGHSNSVGRRGYELAIKIPVPPRTIHAIKTDDPEGVEAYWHRRFASKRGEGEWFALSREDVQAFKRWKRIF